MATKSRSATAACRTKSSGSSMLRESMKDTIAQKLTINASFKEQSRHFASKDSPSRATLHRSIPPVHELTSYNIGYKPSSGTVRYQKSVPAPTNMTYLPSAQEQLLQSRKIKAKIVGFDATTFEEKSKSIAPEENDSNFNRYNNAFVTGRSPRGLRSTTLKELEMSQSEILKGRSLPATPRLLRGGNSKSYGVRRQISSGNQLELSPDFKTDSPSRKSAIHFNTPAAEAVDHFNIETPGEDNGLDQVFKDAVNNSNGSKRSPYASNFVSPFSNERLDSAKVAVTNGLVVRDRQRDAPWVYCYKIKQDRLKLSKLLSAKGVEDPAVDNLLPSFLT